MAITRRMANDNVARVSERINASSAEIWNALVDPAMIKRYFFGTDVVSEWREGEPIYWKGEWKGKRYQDKGVILRFEPPRLLRFSHYSPLAGLPDAPENYHRVTIELTESDHETLVSLEQDNNATEELRAHSEANWRVVLEGLKELMESGAGAGAEAPR